MTESKMDENPIQPTKFITFARFFKKYMNVSTIVVASIPIPLAKFSLIPCYQSQSTYMSLYASTFCFLIVAFAFWKRHEYAIRLFPEVIHEEAETKTKYNKDNPLFNFIKSVPPLCMVLFAVALFFYHFCLSFSIKEGKKELLMPIRTPIIKVLLKELQPELEKFNKGDIELAKINDIFMNSIKEYVSAVQKYYSEEIKKAGGFTKYILTNTENDDIPGGIYLFLSFLIMFISAEIAFVMMALKEYLQDVLGISDISVILQIYKTSQEV